MELVNIAVLIYFSRPKMVFMGKSNIRGFGTECVAPFMNLVSEFGRWRHEIPTRRGLPFHI